MRRRESSIEVVKEEIRNYYDPDKHHFIVMNAVDLGESIEVQWFFTEYNSQSEVIAFCARVSPGTEVPSMREIIPSAWVAEAELADLMDMKIENTSKGFVLEADAETGPLRKAK